MLTSRRSGSRHGSVCAWHLPRQSSPGMHIATCNIFRPHTADFSCVAQRLWSTSRVARVPTQAGAPRCRWCRLRECKLTPSTSLPGEGECKRREVLRLPLPGYIYVISTLSICPFTSKVLFQLVLVGFTIVATATWQKARALPGNRPSDP